jgi:hypothetical protein
MNFEGIPLSLAALLIASFAPVIGMGKARTVAPVPTPQAAAAAPKKAEEQFKNI